ncbi:polysaccharide deacetylase family protein [Microbacteriaceae bacterium 4G12]
MKKYVTIALLSSLILAGCNTAVAKQKKEAKTNDSNKEVKPVQVVLPQGLVTWDPITNQSNSTVLYTKDLRDSFTEVQYHIWRTADGQGSKKVFSSKDAANNFALPFQLQAFNSKRGEYQIETYGIKADGQQVDLVKSSITFQQYVPILMYHYVDEYKGEGIKSLFVHPTNFEAQMKYLKDNGYTLLTFERWTDVNKVNKPIFVTFDDGAKNNVNALAIFQKLKDEHFQPAATEYLVTDSLDLPGKLTKDDVKQMSDSGIFSIQSHTLTHANLPFVPTELAETELKQSKEKIEALTGKPVISLAYPVGYYSNEIVEMTKKYYQYAVTTDKGQFVEKGKPNELYLMERIIVMYDTSLQSFAASIKEKLY